VEPEQTTASRLIAMAVSLVGDAERVRVCIRSSESDFCEYCASRKELPGPELERLISLIIHEQGHIIARNRELLAELREKRNGAG
jgi:hypothetical protein